jgi:3-hydroxyisobutyrate dehydrogenase-like beta-hydroxyacid dehydrogenase
MSEHLSLKLGFIGLGIMGAPMAGHLRAAGHAPVRAHTRSQVPQALPMPARCLRQRAKWRSGRHRLPDAARHARRAEGAVRRERRGQGLTAGQDWSST